MNNQLQEKLKLLVDNHRTIKSDFIWQDGMAKRLAVLCYTMENKEINTAAIKECHKMIKSETSAFSNFRGNLAIYLSAALSLHPQPSHVLADTLHVYGLLKEKFWSSDYLIAAAYEIAINSEKGRHARTVQRTKDFFDEMKANHRFHIGQDDYIFAAMLALSAMDTHAGAVKIKNLFLRLKSEFSIFVGASSVLHLAQMLVLGGGTEDCVSKLLRLNKLLRKRKLRLDKTYTLPTLGVLGMLKADNNLIADELVNAKDYFRAQKGFGPWSVGNEEILLYSAALLINAYAGDTESNIINAGVTTSVTNLIIAIQVALIVSATMASSAAVASSST